MSDELRPAVIKHTQDILGKYVKKPNLTEKLLKKPPFRFLFDILFVIIRDTKCFVGLYTQEELAYENIKDRDDKMKFLQKIIDVVKLTTGSSLAIKTSKIVAGHEPEKTNELLQLVGEIVEKNLDWKKAVEDVVSGKSSRKKSPRKPNEATNKTSKDGVIKAKPKEKNPKEKDTNLKDSKPIKSSGSKAVVAATNKDDKNKKSKTKENNTMPKESTSKRSKELDKSLKKPVNDHPSNRKQKLKKIDSQPSNKDSSTLNSQEAKQQPKAIQNELDGKHDVLEQQGQDPKIISNATELPPNILSDSNEVLIDSQNDAPQMKSLSVEKSKQSAAKSRKPNVEKLIPNVGEKDEDNEKKKTKEMTNPLVLTKDKLEILVDENMKAVNQDSLTASMEQEKTQKYVESKALDKNQNETSSPTPPTTQKMIHKPIQSSPPPSSNNEMKRESTFTRENSIDSNKSSLANRPRTTLRPPSARPPSARPGAPRRRDKNIEIVLQPNDQIKMSGIQVKLETFGDLDDDGENLVIIENPNANDVTQDQQINLTESEKTMQDETLEQGHLVQQILETQKELVQQQIDAGSLQKYDKESTNNAAMRQTSARHMDNLRDVIQNITKSVNPLGKLMDFIPEDIDAMQLEFTMWRDSYTQAANELKREKSLTESAIEPMKIQLVQIEASIAEYMEMLDASRVKILQNSEKIFKMLTT